MAAVAPSADQPTDLMQKLSLDAQSKTLEMPEVAKKSSNQNGSVDGVNAANGQIQSYDGAVTEPTVCFVPNSYPYYYGGYDGTGGDWDNFPRYANAEGGVDMSSGFYGDNGSLVYHGYGFAPYGPYSPAASSVPGNDQLYGTQQYHYPSPYFQSNMTPTSAPFTPSAAAPQAELSTSAASDQKPLPVETVNGNSNTATNAVGKGNNRSASSKTSNQNSSYNSNGSLGRGSLPGGMASGNQDPRLGFDGFHSPIPWAEGALFPDGQIAPLSTSGATNSFPSANNSHSRNQHFRPNSNFMGLHQTRPLSGMGVSSGYMNRMYPNKLYGQYGGTIRSGMGFGSSNYDSRTNGRGWLAVDSKYKNRGHGNGYYAYANENVDGLNELNRGPRAKGSKNQKAFTPILAVKGQTFPSSGTNEEEKNKVSVIPDREQYNKADFPEDYEDAKFFIIKSYSEDDVHKSIKYSVWASTPNGNKKLDAAYREAQEKPGSSPVFLFFSVNTSGQFVGLAEMVGPVDFHKSVEYWQQDKWNGCFPVKWHIVKDVPNSMLKHITLENNENKPVTNSRDTQEVKLVQGLKMIKIFKEHPVKTCLFDDFEFYENRQKAIQEKKARQQYQKQVWEGKGTSEKKEMANGELKPQKSVEVVAEFVKETPAAQANGDMKLSDDVATEKKADEAKIVKAVAPEKKALSNGVAN